MKKILKGLKHLYTIITGKPAEEGRNWKLFSNKEYANELMYKTLMADGPCMIARYGSTEMGNLINYIGVKKNNRSKKDFITGKSLKWWWEPSIMKQLQVWSGFFPATQKNIEAFCDLMLNDTQEVDILGSWLLDEQYLAQGLIKAKRVMLEDLEPFFCSNPWTRALKGKKVLVVHPFAETIEKQYQKRELLFENNLLPAFELKTIKAVQSVAGSETAFNDWFEALEHMKQQIDAADYDVCIIGCGAYGFPLAAHVKRSGKKAIHMAGATQLLFGIKGKRWENYIVWPYMNLFNEHWVRPGDNEKPKNANVVEGACYW
ncbi:hypothetical protein [Maribacter luteus]|uniref:Uncharacterized protein n=1 Tax=Maribacter luteus TaxID=2594478 RepID=A0A6I2MLF9_9FLAO|nr:hypothetical protein [Maribacter luteus]MRX63335.1 hypothetical protein [Maribacter luteus]